MISVKFGFVSVKCFDFVSDLILNFDLLDPSPPVKDYRFSVGQLPAWAKKQVSYFDVSFLPRDISTFRPK